MKKKILTDSSQETQELGEKIGRKLKAGSIICLSGEMGAGKTAISQGIAKGVGVDDYVTSPTYTIINEYEGRLPIYHFDVFRIEDSEELFQIGFDEYIEGPGIVIIEWACHIRELLPPEYLWIDIEKSGENNQRSFILKPKGQYYQKLIKEL